MIGLNRILVGDAREQLAKLPEESIDCVVTSPPYFRLRNYQQRQQIGLEAHIEEWVEDLRAVAREMARVLVPTGSLWLNIGDTYSTGRDGGQPKSLLLGPERLALALLEDGWLLRSKIIWAKQNPMPEPARDRLSSTWEVVYLLVRERRYFFDLDGIRVPHRSAKPPSKQPGQWSVPKGWRVTDTAQGGLDALKAAGLPGHPLGKNPGDVWSLATASYRGAHHAVFPVALAERPILAGCPERRCSRCLKPYEREPFRQLGHLAVRGEIAPTCDCDAPWEPGVVLDPFMGSGTTAIAAERHRRNWLGVELNPAFANLAEGRIAEAREDSQADDAPRPEEAA
jgi:DNA modification methylase